MKAIVDLQALAGVVDPGGDRAKLTAWRKRLQELPTVPTSPESKVETALENLFAPRNGLTNGNGNPQRRSARLVRMVQGTVGGSPSGPGYYLGVADLPGAAAGPYQNLVQTASEEAAKFLDAAKDMANGGGTAIGAALKNLLDANPVIITGDLRYELTELKEAILVAVAVGGAGDGSAYWPSIFISSSSSSGG